MPTGPDLERHSQVIIIGRDYSYTFSRGLLAHSLETYGLPLDKAYEVAKKVQRVLIEENIYEIAEDNLRRYVRDQAIEIAGKEVAYQYNIIEKWHGSSIPLIILLAGVRGTGTTRIGESLSKKLGMSQMFATSIVMEVMRRMISNDLAPELHSRSFEAHENLRPIYSVLYDKVLIGFEEHSRFPAEGVEAIVQRAIDEGLSMLIRGQHLVPRFLSEALIHHPNVLYICLERKDEEAHLERYLSYYDESEWEERKEHFEPIRKIHDYLVEEARNRKHLVLESTDRPETVDKIYTLVLERLATLFSEGQPKAPGQTLDKYQINS